MNSPVRRHILAVALAILVVASGAIVALRDASKSRVEIDRWTQERSEVVESVVQDLLDDAFDDLEAMAAYVTHGSPSGASFQSFVDDIGGASNSIGMGYIEWVPADQVETHLAERRASLGDFYDFLGLAPGTAFPEPLASTVRSDRTEFYPVQLFATGEQIRPFIGDDVSIAELGLGLDVGYDPAWRELVAKAIDDDGRHLSAFFAIEAEEFRFDRLFFGSVPVKREDGTPAGIVASVMLEPLLLQNTDTELLDDVQWEVVPIGGSPTRIDSDSVRFFDLGFPNAPWRLAVAPTEEALGELTGRSPWIVGLGVSVAMALIAFSLWLLVDRRRERNRSVNLKAVAAEKDRFLASVSHELRTPLRVVSGLAHELTENGASFEDAERRELMAMLTDQTEELSAIVEDLLVAARSDIGNVTIHYSKVDLRAEAESALRTSDVSATVRGNPAAAYGDPQRVRQILRNLLTNATRYGGPEVRVDFAEGTDWVELVVSDNGDGVPREMREIIFAPYLSAHQPTTQVRSVGLGLYISRNLARAMGGDLEYVYDGEWSHFRLRLQPCPGDSRHATLEHRGAPAEPSSVA